MPIPKAPKGTKRGRSAKGKKIPAIVNPAEGDATEMFRVKGASISDCHGNKILVGGEAELTEALAKRYNKLGYLDMDIEDKFKSPEKLTKAELKAQLEALEDAEPEDPTATPASAGDEDNGEAAVDTSGGEPAGGAATSEVPAKSGKGGGRGRGRSRNTD